MKISPIRGAPKGAGNSAKGRGAEQLIELYRAVGILYGDDRVAELDQIFLLHGEELLPNLLGLFFGRKCNHEKIIHRPLLFRAARLGASLVTI